MIRRRPTSTLFPSTTLFRSIRGLRPDLGAHELRDQRPGEKHPDHPDGPEHDPEVGGRPVVDLADPAHAVPVTPDTQVYRVLHCRVRDMLMQAHAGTSG